MDAAEEFKKQFPGEHLKSISRARVHTVPAGAETAAAEQPRGGWLPSPGALVGSLFVFDSTKEAEKYKTIRVPIRAEVALSKGVVAFFFEPKRYRILMALLAIAVIATAILLLISNQSLITLVAVLLGFITLLVGEGFLYLEMKRSAVTAFDRSLADVSYDKATRALRVTGFPMGEESLKQKTTLEADLLKGEADPNL